MKKSILAALIMSASLSAHAFTVPAGFAQDGITDIDTCHDALYSHAQFMKQQSNNSIATVDGVSFLVQGDLIVLEQDVYSNSDTNVLYCDPVNNDMVQFSSARPMDALAQNPDYVKRQIEKARAARPETDKAVKAKMAAINAAINAQTAELERTERLDKERAEDESKLVYCQAKNGKVAEVVVTEFRHQVGNVIQYTFGKPGKADITLTGNSITDKNADASYTFQNKNTTYTVSDRELVVKQDDKVLATIQCQ